MISGSLWVLTWFKNTVFILQYNTFFNLVLILNNMRVDKKKFTIPFTQDVEISNAADIHDIRL